MMHLRRLVAVACVIISTSYSAPRSLVARQDDRSSMPLPQVWSQGYVKPLSGDVIVYPWAYPGQVETLLSRATDGRMAVEWEGAPLPPGPADQLVTYLWHAGTATGYGAHRFTLRVNDRPFATFTSGQTTADREWVTRGEGEATLRFKTTRVGSFNELFGFMWLTAPRSLFGTGAPRFQVVGEAANSQDYYLGQKQPVTSWVRVRPEEAVLAGGQRAIRLEVSQVGSAATLTLKTGSQTLWTGTAGTGYTSALVPAGPNRKATLPLVVELGGRTALEEPLELTPVRHRDVHLLPHSHVDIGYSDPQPAVERKQWNNLRDAVELARKTASYPPEAQFKWNVEGLWSVESYLKQASPADREAFVAAVRQGSIGLQANYTNLLTGLATPEELRHWTDAARQMRTTYGFAPIRSAMHSDIPGLSWTVVSALAESGVRYFSSGPNYVPGMPDRGDRIGATIKALGDKPFWWAAPRFWTTSASCHKPGTRGI
jgi:alpha-mannosidase